MSEKISLDSSVENYKFTMPMNNKKERVTELI